MKTLKDYEELIRYIIWTINSQGIGWTFTVKSLSEDQAYLHWSFFDYYETENDCFSIRLVFSGNEYTLRAEDNYGGLISKYSVVESAQKDFNQFLLEDAIKCAIRDIIRYTRRL